METYIIMHHNPMNTAHMPECLTPGPLISFSKTLKHLLVMFDIKRPFLTTISELGSFYRWMSVLISSLPLKERLPFLSLQPAVCVFDIYVKGQ